MAVYVVVGSTNECSGGVPIGVFTTKEKAINKIISWMKIDFNKLDESKIKKLAKSQFGSTDKSVTWNDFKKIIKNEFEEENSCEWESLGCSLVSTCEFGLFGTDYEIIKHKLDK